LSAGDIQGINQRIAFMIGPNTVDIGVRIGDPFVGKIKPLNQAKGGKIVGHNKGFHPMNRKGIEKKLQTSMDTFVGITLVEVLSAEFIAQAAAFVRPSQEILKAEGTDDLLGMIL
jgi:hypothetical protein